MNEMSDDDVSRRLRAANPVPSDRTRLPSGRSIEQLMEETMANTTDEARTQRPTRWRLMAAAAVVAAAAAGSAAYLATRSSDTSHHARSVLALKLPQATGPVHPGGAGGACIVFSVELLAQRQLAFSGTVESVTDSTVEITVDHWYKGGTADVVDLATPGDSNALREIAVNFETGHRYLVSANDGVVSGCGYTGEYSADLAADFAKAFGS